MAAKEIVVSWDGDASTWGDYTRKVRLQFEKTPPHKRKLALGPGPRFEANRQSLGCDAFPRPRPPEQEERDEVLAPVLTGQAMSNSGS